MSDRTPALLPHDARRHTGVALVSPSSLSDLAPLFIAAGVALAIAGWLDIALFYNTPRLGDAAWELGTVARSLDAMPLATLGLVLLTIGVRARGGSAFWLRGMSIALAVVGVLCLLGLGVLALDIPPAFNAIRGAGVGANPQTNALASSGVKLGIAKAIGLAVSYSVAYAWMAVNTWLRAGRRPNPSRR